jgi:DNA mismatch repair protein MutS
MTFRSVLFARSEDGERASTAMMPSCFCDLNLDQVVDAITATKNEYNLKPFFYVPLRDVDSILFRYEVMQDLGEATLFSNLRSFAEKMRKMREHLARSVKTSYKYQHEWWCLEAVNIYCDAIDCLLVDLSAASLQSRGLAGFREYVKAYAQSKRFTELHEETTALKVGLDGITYGLLLRQGATD